MRPSKEDFSLTNCPYCQNKLIVNSYKDATNYYCNNKGRNHAYLLRVNDDIDDIYEEFFLMSELVAVVYESNNFNSTIKTYDTVVIKYFPVGNIYFPINNNWINLVRNFLILS